jgi:hypothetical protein
MLEGGTRAWISCFKALGYQVRAVIQAQGLCLTAIQYSQVQIAPQVYTCLCLSSQTLNMHKHLRAFSC